MSHSDELSDNRADYDLVIAGGGLVGLSLANALAASGNWRIAMVEAQPESASVSASFDERVLALSAMTVRILKSLDLWRELAEQGSPIGQIHISDQGSYGKTRLYAKQQGLDEFGRVMPARLLGEVLQKRAAQFGFDWYRPDSIVAMEVNDHFRQITLDSGRVISTQLLVVAEGADSVTCQLMQMQGLQHDYQHTAIIANIVAEQPHHNWAFERFTAHGPLALLPMSENRRSLVWTHTLERAAALMALDDDAFTQELQLSLGYRFGLLEKVGARFSYPLQLLLLEQTIRNRAVVLGNAAHTLHPIAGQGFNLGIRDVMELALQLTLAKRAQAKLNAPAPFDAGDYSLLSRYEAARRQDQQGVANATHLLAKLFSNSLSPLQISRSIGLCALAHLEPARTAMIQKAMGLSALSNPPEALVAKGSKV